MAKLGNIFRNAITFMVAGFNIGAHLVSGSNQPLETNGCQRLRHMNQPEDDTSFSFIFDNGHHYSADHMRGVLSEHILMVQNFLNVVEPEKNEWSNYLPITHTGLRELYPTSTDTLQFTNTPTSSKHRVLREMRYLITNLEMYILLLNASGQLGIRDGRMYVNHITLLSINLDRILNMFHVDFNTLPEEALCRTVFPLSNGSVSYLRRFTSIILKDAFNALNRIHHVLSSCQVRGHNAHRHRLLCTQHSSLFYSTLPFQNEEGLSLDSLDQIQG